MNQTTDGHDKVTKSSTTLMLLMHDLRNFREYIQRNNWAPVQSADGLNSSDAQKYQNGCDLISKAYAGAQTNTSSAITVADNLQTVVDSTTNYTQTFLDNYDGVFTEATKEFLADPKGNADAKGGMIELGQNIQEAYQSFLKDIKDARTSIENEHNVFNTDIADMNQGIQAFEGLDGGVKLDIKNLSEATLRDQLMKRADDLRGKISKLERDCGLETAGAVGGGLIVGAFALSNFWNPIGWVAGAGLVVGEVFLGLDLKKRFDELHENQEELAVTKDEQQLLKPLFTIKRMKDKMKTVSSELDTLSTELGKCIDEMNFLIVDLKKENVDIDKLKKWSLIADQKNITSKYKDLEKALNKLADASLKTILDPKLNTNKPAAAS